MTKIKMTATQVADAVLLECNYIAQKTAFFEASISKDHLKRYTNRKCGTKFLSLVCESINEHLQFRDDSNCTYCAYVECNHDDELIIIAPNDHSAWHRIYCLDSTVESKTINLCTFEYLSFSVEDVDKVVKLIAQDYKPTDYMTYFCIDTVKINLLLGRKCGYYFIIKVCEALTKELKLSEHYTCKIKDTHFYYASNPKVVFDKTKEGKTKLHYYEGKFVETVSIMEEI